MMLSRLTTKLLLTVLVCGLFISASAQAYDFKPEIVSALEQKDSSLVLTLLDKEIDLDASYAPLYLLKGKIFYNQGRFDDALEQLEIALKKKSKLYEALYYKGLVYLKTGNLEEAFKALEKGTKKSKDEKADFHNGLGLYYLATEEYSKADLEFRKASQVGPDQAEYHANLGDANYYSKIYALAINEYNLVIEMDTTFLDVYFRLARAYVAQKQYNNALEQLSVVLVRDSTYAYAWKEAGKLYSLAGISSRNRETREQRFKESIGSYRKFIELSGDSADGEVFFNMGRSLFFMGGYPQADSAFEYVLSLGDVPTSIFLYLGKGKIGEKQYQVGIDYLKKHLDQMIEKNPEWVPMAKDADLYRRMGDAYKALEDNYNAAINFVIASDLVPTNSRYAIQSALAYHQLKEFADALKYYERSIEIGPDSWNILMNAAYCNINLEAFEEAIAYLEKVVELEPTKEKAYQLISTTYMNQLADCANGIAWTEKLLAVDSGNCEAMQSLGFAYFAGSCTINYPKAISYFKKTLSCFKAKGQSNCGNSNVLLYIAQAYHLQAAELVEADKKEASKKAFKNAFDWYNKVLKCDPGNADAQKGRDDTEFEF